MVLIFYDWEFDAETNPEIIEPISLGLQGEDGRDMYLINKDFDWDNCKSQWLKENVRPQLILPGIRFYQIPKTEFNQTIMRWLAPWICDLKDKEKRIKLIGYYADYDHVCLVQRFGTMMELPEHIPMWSHDLKQWCADLGDPRLPEQKQGEHNALLDAKWCRDAYRWLVENYEHPAWTPGLQKPKHRVTDLSL